jgi:histidine kinase
MGLAPVAVLVIVATTFSGILKDEDRSDNHEAPRFFETMIRSPSFREAVHAAFRTVQHINVASLSPQGLAPDPDKFKHWDQGLEATSSALVVQRQGKILFMGKLLRGQRLPILPTFGNFKPAGSIPTPFRIIGNLDLRFADGSLGSVNVLWNASGWDHELNTFTFWLVGLFSLTLLALNTFFTWFILLAVLDPIARLRQASQRIALGQLDDPNWGKLNKDEWKPLFDSFDAMRRTLAENRALAQSYENDRKQLISHIAHDLRTPITAIGGYARGILEGVANTEEKRRSYLEIITTKARDLERMAQELFFLSNLDKNAVTYDFQCINAQAFLKDSAEELALDGADQGLRLTLKALPGPDIFLRGDVVKLRTVFFNLAENTLKFKRLETVEWTWDAHVEAGSLVLKLSDNGSGISPEALPRIFERFFREDTARTSLIPGTGLGLAIVQRIILDHGGQVSAESQVGQGSVFTLTLPLAPKEKL